MRTPVQGACGVVAQCMGTRGVADVPTDAFAASGTPVQGARDVGGTWRARARVCVCVCVCECECVCVCLCTRGGLPPARYLSLTPVKSHPNVGDLREQHWYVGGRLCPSSNGSRGVPPDPMPAAVVAVSPADDATWVQPTAWVSANVRTKFS